MGSARQKYFVEFLPFYGKLADVTFSIKTTNILGKLF